MFTSVNNSSVYTCKLFTNVNLKHRNMYVTEQTTFNEPNPGASMGLLKQSVTDNSNSTSIDFSYKVLQFRANYLLQYDYRTRPHIVNQLSIETLEENRKNTYKGEISANAQKVIMKRIHVWNNAIVAYNTEHGLKGKQAERSLVFVTLTLPATQVHTDKEVKSKVLRTFMRSMIYEFETKHYIWKAEKQENGNIHFHLVFDKYIDKKRLGEKWNLACEKLGYVSMFEKKHGHRNPPSTNIKAVTCNRDISNYIAKYVGKFEEGKLIEGAVWKCSTDLLKLTYFEKEVDNETTDELIEKLEAGILKAIIKENFILFVPGSHDRKIELSSSFSKDLHQHYLRVYHYLYRNVDCLTYDQFVYPGKHKVQRSEYCTNRQEIVKCEQERLRSSQLKLFKTKVCSSFLRC